MKKKTLLKTGAAVLLLQSGLAAATPADEAPAGGDAAGAVIVTGTRASGLKVENSASPIQVLDSASLSRTGQPDLIQALAQNLPSFTAQAFGGDTANLTLSMKLRGLSPNNTLVLINGKRRHGTSNLAVLGGPYQGGAAADLNYIPVAAIDHIEVLQDGAAAQYGSDAIAGVVNIILKSNYRGGNVNANAGGYVDGGGRTADAMINLGTSPMDKAFLSLTAESKYHGFSDRGGIDPRVVDPNNVKNYPLLLQAPGYPHLNRIAGDAQYHLQIFSANAGVELDEDTSLYSFGTWGRKTARAFENYRMPSSLPAVYPTGYSPLETMAQEDYALTVGMKGKLASGWNWDLSTTYGTDISKVGVSSSANVSLFKDTGATPTEFDAGGFQSVQWTNSLELNKEFDIGWATPLTVATGLEQRTDKYVITAGDPASRYKEGSQSYPGFQLTDAGSHSRTNGAVYVDFAGSPVKELTLDVAARFEHFSDFGNASVGKLTMRYDFSPEAGLRSTISNGFRAPTLAEEYYSSTNVGPTSAFVQLPPNSAGAKLVGVDGLKAEKSNNFSIGLVLKPTPTLMVTVDAYQIDIKDRIVGSGTLYSSGGANNSPAVTAAIKANGNVLEPGVTQTGINIFSNAVNTRNRGLEIVATTSTNHGDLGRVDWSAAANFNSVKVTGINQAPAQLQPQKLLDATAISNIETASPKARLNLSALWKKGPWTVNLREAVYGPASQLGSYDGAVYYETKIGTKAITDLETSYRLENGWTLSVGANNLFNTYPDQVNADLLAIRRAKLSNSAVTIYPTFSSIGINGGYYYARAAYKF